MILIHDDVTVDKYSSYINNICIKQLTAILKSLIFLTTSELANIHFKQTVVLINSHLSNHKYPNGC